MGDGAQVNILQLAAYWHAARQTGDLDAPLFECFAQHMRSGLTFCGEVGRQDNFFDDTIAGASTNGWVLWKSKDGKTLDELKRQKTEGA